jgi:hypothetical protein
MQLELTREEADLLKMLLKAAEVTTRIEIHHARTYDFKDMLKKREIEVSNLLARFEQAYPQAA